jgi:hypothetical protein
MIFAFARVALLIAVSVFGFVPSAIGADASEPPCSEWLGLRSGQVVVSPECVAQRGDLPALGNTIAREADRRRAEVSELAQVVEAANTLLTYAVQHKGPAADPKRRAEYAVAKLVVLIGAQWDALASSPGSSARDQTLEAWKRDYLKAQPGLDAAEQEFLAAQALEDQAEFTQALSRYAAAVKALESIGYVDLEYQNAYAARAREEGEDRLAARAYERALAEARKRAALYPERYLEHVAQSLSHCAGLCKAEPHNAVPYDSINSNMTEEAYRMYSEAMGISRELAAASPQRYSAGLAEVLCEFGFDSASQVAHSVLLNREFSPGLLNECFTLYRELARREPERYRPLLANALITYIPTFFHPTASRVENQRAAIGLIAEGVAIFRELAVAEPRRYLPEVARGLHLLGIQQLYFARVDADAKDRPIQLELAAGNLREARDLYRQLHSQEHKRFAVKLAKAHLDLGDMLHKDLKRYSEAYEEGMASLELSRVLVKSDAGFRRWWVRPYADSMWLVRVAAAKMGNTAVEEEMKAEIQAAERRRRWLGEP